MSGRARALVFLLVFMLFLSGTQFAFIKKKKLPDLIAAGLSGHAAATAGAHLQNVVAMVVNQGKRPAGAFRIHYYISLDDRITTDDIDTGPTCEVGGLPSGETVACHASLDLPASLAPGTYYLGAIADDQNA